MESTVKALLERIRYGDQQAVGALVDILYDELRLIAAGKLRTERNQHTLQTTALVHEVYLKMVGNPERQFADRGHFLAVAATVMRQVLVDYARARASQKRGGVDPVSDAAAAIELAGVGGQSHERVQLLDLERALNELAVEDPALAVLIEMRYFGGMTAEECAESLARSVHMVRHDFRLAQAWLRRRLATISSF